MVVTPLPVVFGPGTCGRLEHGADREWLVADGVGGYAMGSVPGLRTRRYHGLQVVAGATPASRDLGLVALDAVVTLPSGHRVELAVHEWAGGAVSPRGHELLESFDLADGLPRWRWRVGDVVLERVLAMHHGRPSLGVVHRLVAGGPVTLDLTALCTWRNVHGERHAGDGDLQVAGVAGGAVVAGAYRLRGPGWRGSSEWYHGVHAREESARGLPADEDVCRVGAFSAGLEPGDVLEVSCWAGDLATEPPPAVAVVDAARARSRALVAAASPGDEVDARLVLAADAFIVAGPDVVAGYPWFGAWARDTMTSYAGLFLATGRAAEGRELLLRYAATLSEGMLANTADTGSTEYNTADGTLWFLHALDRHVAATGDCDLAAELLPAVDGIVAAHLRGTRYGIGVDPADGLLRQGEPGVALTWMDARVDGVGVTPRIGKAVEIEALWVNGLGARRALAAAAGADPEDVSWVEALARASILDRFGSPDGGLLDVVDGPDGADPSVRPNQLLALSLPHVGVPHGAVLDAVAPLLTPLGLRSLAPGSPGYAGRHRGGPAERDRAYHQGTVWPWLIGPYVDAAAGAGSLPDGLLRGLDAHLLEFGLGSVSETADGDPPHAATGCPFQAWSVAELLRARRVVAAGRNDPTARQTGAG